MSGRHVRALWSCVGNRTCTNEATETTMKHGFLHPGGRLNLVVCEVCETCAPQLSETAPILVIGGKTDLPYPVREPKHRADSDRAGLVAVLASPSAMRRREQATWDDPDSAVQGWAV